jgi:hypothetical protein
MRQTSSDAQSGKPEVATNGSSDSESDSRGPSAQVVADEDSLAAEKGQRISVSESNSESEDNFSQTKSRTKRVFAVVLACVVVAVAAGAVIFFASRSKPDQSRNTAASLSPSQRKVEKCVTTIGVPAEEAINDLENFNESAMATVMAGFSVAHGAAEYGVLQSVVSNVAQNLTSASWASSWKSAIKHEFPTIESYCERQYSPSSITTSTVTGASTSPGTSPQPCFGFSGSEWDSLAKSLLPVIGLGRVRYVSSNPTGECIATIAFKRDPSSTSWASWWITPSKDVNFPNGGGLSREVDGHWILEEGPGTLFCNAQPGVPASVSKWFFPGPPGCSH